ncbi:hypothetical protein SASPL_154778 [Salvia splendens]|uniref:Uncharacterized protein n=1 Tax=Salvia splendens TaxID=180675 RepID=A0A8X8W0P3_SALSN|nr:uncharacterized protein LOC121786090 [Salvia splendens]KAG6385895.1 hypothetical protein SASPL_154778 [Salvia splendens]
MAIEVFPDSPSATGISPRISFSHDLSQSDVVPIEQYIRSAASSSSIDFDFCVFREIFDHESSSADELFFDGKILPIQIKKRLAPAPPPPSPLPPPPPPPLKSEEKHKSFWRFKRSSSLNCGSGYGRTLCPLPLLSRSNSTGSTASGKRSSISKQNLLKSNSSQKQQQQQPMSGYSSKPPLKKNGQFSHKFSPVLNVPPATIFGLGSIFSGGGKDRIRKKY